MVLAAGAILFQSKRMFVFGIYIRKQTARYEIKKV